MIISGIVLMAPRDRLGEVCARVDALPWADVHFSDVGGRVVVTIEADGVDESMERLKRLQGLRDVISAELAQYYVEDPHEREVGEGGGPDAA